MCRVQLSGEKGYNPKWELETHTRTTDVVEDEVYEVPGLGCPFSRENTMVDGHRSVLRTFNEIDLNDIYFRGEDWVRSTGPLIFHR